MERADRTYILSIHQCIPVSDTYVWVSFFVAKKVPDRNLEN